MSCEIGDESYAADSLVDGGERAMRARANYWACTSPGYR